MKYMTKQRQAIYNFFKQNSHQQYTPQELFDNLVDEKISISAIYRNLVELEKENFIEKIINSNNVSSYMCVNTEECSGLLHLICNDCSTTFHATKEFSDVVKAYEKSNGFSVNINKTILYGKCNNCK